MTCVWKVQIHADKELSKPECHYNDEGKGSYGVDHGSNKGRICVVQACKVHIKSHTNPEIFWG